jgi:alpha-beta hydrolase superfamily lysophospholipase
MRDNYFINCVKSKDNLKIFYHSWKIDNAKANILLIPGYAEHGKRYEELALFFNTKSFNFFAIDNRGHGLSEGLRGHTEDFSNYARDISLILNEIKTINNFKIFLMGHSMGGLIATDFVINFSSYTKDFLGVILISPLFKVKINAPVKKFFGIMLSYIVPKLKFTNEIDPFLLTHDKEKAGAYKNDPLIFKHVTCGWYKAMLDKQNEIKKLLNSIKIPLYALIAEHDQIVCKEESFNILSKINLADKKIELAKNCYHEVLNEISRKEIYERLLKWIEEKTQN